MTTNMAGKTDCGDIRGPLRDGHVALSMEQPRGLLLKMAQIERSEHGRGIPGLS